MQLRRSLLAREQVGGVEIPRWQPLRPTPGRLAEALPGCMLCFLLCSSRFLPSPLLSVVHALLEVALVVLLKSFIGETAEELLASIHCRLEEVADILVSEACLLH